MSGVSGPRGAGRGRIVPLPSAARIARDIDRMIAFGPRLPGHPNHTRFVDWLEAEFAAAGLQILPDESHPYRRWDPRAFGLDVEGAAGAIGRHAYYVRSRPTGPDGVTGPLTYGGGINAAGPARLAGIPAGSIVVFD
ncbi:MAG: hypothetical protein IT480_05050, partial [Gammaproteobacteria bacterium]|nr:hypothetical protein [Gammaproteobacteria bacterium]